MSKSIGQKEVEKQYKKERRRIQQFIKRAEKRGYIFEKEMIPQMPKRITKASVNRLHKITPDKLYLGASYVDDSGTVHYGKRTKYTTKINYNKTNKVKKEYIKHPRVKETIEPQYDTEQLIKDIEERKERQEQERKERAKANKPYPKESWIKTLVEMYGIDSKQVQDWLKEHPTDKDYYNLLKDDYEHKHRLETQEEYREQFKQGTLVYDRIISIINDWRNTGNFDTACDFIEQRINEAIESVGKEIAMRNLSEELDMKTSVDKAILYFGRAQGDMALQEILTAIMKRPLTAEETQHFSTLVENRWTEREEQYGYTGEELDFE